MQAYKIQEFLTAILLLIIVIVIINKYGLIKKTKLFFSHIVRWQMRAFWAWLAIGTLLIQSADTDTFNDQDEATVQFIFFSTLIFTAYTWVLKAYDEKN